ncbi:methyltransferase domain-containing protein [Candidatus Kaiserbacteria bacterium]|nr:methyltransferase domain-containing protein [Candidatus Kaiserbacteria bacterium]
MYYKSITKCRICGSEALTAVVSFPSQFLSPTFVSTNENNELSKIKVPLTVMLCDRSKNQKGCGLLQLKETTDHDLLYSNYFYRSATNSTMRKDLKYVVDEALKRVKTNPGDVVVDIGANDCTMLSYFPSHLDRIGVEPAKNISWGGIDSSLRVVNDYFSKKAVADILSGRQVSIFTSCAMFYDLDDPNTFVAEIKSLLAPNGVWCIQLSYLVSMLKNMNFYDICHEHLEYYSLETLENLMIRHGLTIFDAETNAVNGGSVLVFITHTSTAPAVSENLKKLLKEEKSMDLFNARIYVQFDEKIRALAKIVRNYILDEIKIGKLVVGLGASTKGNVLLQLFGITKEILPFITEINPEKIGLRTLGTDIELISDEKSLKLNPSCKLVLPWYFKKEIVKREIEYLNRGGKLLFPMPYTHVVTKKEEKLLS